MTHGTANLRCTIALAALAMSLAGCKAFDLGPQTDLALAANAAARGYPDLVDIPAEPADIACIRAALGQTLSAVSAPDAPSTSSFNDDNAAGMSGPPVLYQVRLAPPPSARRENSLLGLAGGLVGANRDVAAPAAPQLIDCPPGPLIETERLTAQRQALEAEAAAIRAQRPAPPAPIALPDDLPERPGAPQ